MVPTKEQMNLVGTSLVEVLTGDWSVTDRQVSGIAIGLYRSDVGNSLCRQLGVFDYADVPGDTGLRVSQLGKPAVLQACALPHIQEELEELGVEIVERQTMKMRELLHRGDQWEAWVIAVLKIFGCNVTQEQADVEYMGVKGHIDFVVDGLPGVDVGPVLVEVKTMSGNYFNQFTRQPNDDRGYLTQLTCYSKALGLPAVWLCLDKSTHNVAVVQHPGPDAELKVLNRLERVVPKLKSVTCLEDVFTMFSPPPGVPEVFKREETGKMLLPPSMRYSSLRHIFYQINSELNGYGKTTEYVGGVKTYPEAVEFLTACSNLCST